MAWMNNDGLYIKYGQEEGEAGLGGQFGTVDHGGQHVIELDVDLTTLGSSAAILDDNTLVPAGYTVMKVEIQTTTAVTGDTAALNVGLIRRDRTTELDYNGLIAAAAITTFNAVGETVSVNTAGQTAVGALVGTVLAYSGYLTADYDTTAFTAGVVKLRVFLQKV